WADCFGSSGTSILNKYKGRCALSSWLISVATNRFIDLKRREALRSRLTPEQLPTTCTTERSKEFRSDSTIVSMLRSAILQAFAMEQGELILMLKLVHVHDITQREIGRVWNWHESKVSRALDSIRKDVRTKILTEIRRSDPWLRLEWDDFLD